MGGVGTRSAPPSLSPGCLYASGPTTRTLAVLAHQSQHIYLPHALYGDLVRHYAHVSGAGICRYGESLYRLL
ncbi:hypothetical protein [Caldinitratiruptor microaerophilus]|uniref:Uncharacterized protein n=1 Tax=Caldinitratiruptor microaerophilus TaxID=671077 RepID=A0AA35CPE9_9FIRM|nr:hypothetical protein [Caldinitratiruptor microaerophilus]BDG61316.1 hypothetical protein caldi_24060 [Caldinitratiruptor microaerophilus]